MHPTRAGIGDSSCELPSVKKTLRNIPITPYLN